MISVHKYDIPGRRFFRVVFSRCHNTKTRYTNAMDTHIQEGILSTVAFFDAIDTALTDTEVYELEFDAPKKPTVSQYDDALKYLLMSQALVQSGPFVVLPGREQLIDERIERGLLSEEKFTRAVRVTRFLRFIPFIRMVGVCNTLSFEMSRADGDIDIFIVAEKSRVHIVHMLTTVVLHILGMRRHGFHIANRLCLSFYVATDGLDVHRFALAPRDPYLAQWIRHVIPIFSIHQTAEKYWQANSDWLRTYFSDAYPYTPTIRRQVPDFFISIIIRRTAEVCLLPFAPLLERTRFVTQLRKLKRSASRRMRTQPHDVVVDERTLKFHEEDRRAFYRTKMEQKVADILGATHI